MTALPDTPYLYGNHWDCKLESQASYSFGNMDPLSVKGAHINIKLPGVQQFRVAHVAQRNKQALTLKLLVANSVNTKWYKKPNKWLKPWHMYTHLRVISES